jgi:hypothetical protein
VGRTAIRGKDSQGGILVSDEREKAGVGEPEEDVEAHKNQIGKTTVGKTTVGASDEGNEDDVEAHKYTVGKTQVGKTQIG